MSNIVTRNMRCPTCSAVGTHTVNASMRNEAVLCPTCAESGKRSVCVAVIEPTEEQKQAARLHFYPNDDHYDDATTLALARLLAEREAKLRGEHQLIIATMRRGADELIADNDTLRARVAELEKSLGSRIVSEGELGLLLEASERRVAELEAVVAYQRTTHEADLRGLAARDAQHLARIAELETVYECVANHWRHRLAHYDDAKAAEGGEG